MISAFVGIVGCKNEKNQNANPSPVAVNAIEVRKQPVSYYNTYPGIVVALDEVDLRSEVPGYITGTFFKEGGYIIKGKKLYEIDRSRYQASFEQAKANVDIAAANVEKAQRYADRYAKLIEQEAIARQRYEDAVTDLQNAKLALVAAKAGLVRAEKDLRNSIIIAPFNGIIGISQVKMGDLITPGQSLLNTISSLDPMGVDIVINEKEINNFKKLSVSVTSRKDSTFRIILPDNSVYFQPGKLQIIDRAVDPQTGTIRIRITFPNEDHKLIAGMSCKVNVLNREEEEKIVIPAKSLVEQMSEYFVFVVDSQKAVQKKVAVATMLSGMAIINEGLQEGQVIVTEGVQKVQNGVTVQIDNPTETASR